MNCILREIRSRFKSSFGYSKFHMKEITSLNPMQNMNSFISHASYNRMIYGAFWFKVHFTYLMNRWSIFLEITISLLISDRIIFRCIHDVHSNMSLQHKIRNCNALWKPIHIISINSLCGVSNYPFNKPFGRK